MWIPLGVNIIYNVSSSRASYCVQQTSFAWLQCTGYEAEQVRSDHNHSIGFCHWSFWVTVPKFWEVTANTYPEGVPLGCKQKSAVAALQQVSLTRFFNFFPKLARSQVILVANSCTRMVSQTSERKQNFCPTRRSQLEKLQRQKPGTFFFKLIVRFKCSVCMGQKR